MSNASRMNCQENFNLRSINKFKKPYKLNKSTILKTLKLNANESFHTIDVSSSINKLNNHFKLSKVQHNILWDITDDIDKTESNITNRLENNLNTGCGTYSTDPEIYIQNTNSNINLALDITYSIQLTRNSALTPSDNIDDLDCNIEKSLIINSDIDLPPTEISNTKKSLEICDKNNSQVHSQDIEEDTQEVQALRLCETIISDTSEGMYEIEPIAVLTKNDSLFNGSINDNNFVGAKNDNVSPNITSHHFKSLLTEEMNDIFQNTFNVDNSKTNAIISHEKNEDAFTIERRCNFMPKGKKCSSSVFLLLKFVMLNLLSIILGMSPITKNCNMKVLSLKDDDYYDDVRILN